MHDIQKKRIVLASVLKPVDDTRMHSKLGRSLEKLPGAEVHVIGFPSSGDLQGSVFQHTVVPFSRLSLKRSLAPWVILKKILSIKPHLLIITTHELLVQALIAKMVTRCRFIYDIQENYFRNILYTDSFPLLLRPFLAVYVRMKEIFTSFFTDHFFLAEKSYEHELGFPGNKKTILENKVRAADIFPTAKRDRQKIRLLFTGTLAENTGIFTAISLAENLHKFDPRVTLQIAGYCSRTEILRQIERTIKPLPFIELTGGSQVVPHDIIMKKISESDFGIVAYHVNPSTSGSVPTKMYEYLGARLPVISVDHPPWAELIRTYHAGLLFTPRHTDFKSLLKSMEEGSFYDDISGNMYWEDQEELLLAACKKFITS